MEWLQANKSINKPINPPNAQMTAINEHIISLWSWKDSLGYYDFEV
jgi:hypothetical protein